MRGGNPRGLASGSSQNEFLNHFYWNSSAAGNGLRAAEYAYLKEMQSSCFTAFSPLTLCKKFSKMFLPPACLAHFLIFHMFLYSFQVSLDRGSKNFYLWFFMLFFNLTQNFAIKKITLQQCRVYWNFLLFNLIWTNQLIYKYL